MKTKYSVTIGYKAVISLNVRAENEEDAKKIALEKFKKQKEKLTDTGPLSIEDDSFGAYGVLDMDKTWNEM